MNMIEKQVEMSRAVLEINQNTFQELAKAQQEGLQNYLEMNNDFSKRLPEVKDVATFMELQREYGETLWNSMQEATKSQTDIIRSAVEEATEAFRKGYSMEEAA